MRDAKPTTVMFTDGSAADYPAGALVQRMRAKGSAGELLIVRGMDGLAAYDRSKVHALRVGGTIVSPAITPIAGSGDGGSGGSGYCDPSIQDCPVCNACSGPVPDGQFGDVDCLDGFNCSVDALQNPHGTWVFRFLQPTNLTCEYDFDTSGASCDFAASNTGGGGDMAGNHMISYAYQFISKQVVMRCSPFSGSGLASGNFLTPNGSIFTFPARFDAYVKTSWSMPTAYDSNTAWMLNFFGFPKIYLGFCNGAN